MDHPTLPVVGKNFELIFEPTGADFVAPGSQNYVQANGCLYLFVRTVSILNY